MTFFEQYSYHKKKIGLAIVFVLLFAAIYKRAIHPTIEKNIYLKELNSKLISAKNSTSEIKELNKSISILNNQLGNNNTDFQTVQQHFLTFLENSKLKIGVFELKEVLPYNHPDFIIHSFEVSIKGAFYDQLRFIQRLEKYFLEGKVVHVKFHFSKANGNEPPFLIATLFIQYYSRHEK